MPGFDRLISRREVLLMLLAGLLARARVTAALADDDGDDDGGSGGSGGGGDDGGGSSGSGGGGDRDDGDDDDQKARAAVARGEAAPLSEILTLVKHKFPGQVVRVRLSGTGADLVYRIRLIDRQNRLIEVRVNAGTRRILGAKGV